MPPTAYIQNCVAILATVALILGGYALGAGMESWWGLLLLMVVT